MFPVDLSTLEWENGWHRICVIVYFCTNAYLWKWFSHFSEKIIRFRSRKLAEYFLRCICLWMRKLVYGCGYAHIMIVCMCAQVYVGKYRGVCVYEYFYFSLCENLHIWEYVYNACMSRWVIRVCIYNIFRCVCVQACIHMCMKVNMGKHINNFPSYIR